MGTLRDDLIEQGMELRETHISQVFLADSAVYKIKKPVDLGFLDFTTLERRRSACDAEVALNRRLAPSVYRSVLPVARDARGVHRLGTLGAQGALSDPLEWAVEMRRLPDHDAADHRLAEGRLSRDDVRRLAERLARFHADARCDAETSRFGAPDVIEANVRENFEQTRQSALRHIGAVELAAIERWQLEFLRERRGLLEARMAEGRVRDGHGDLRLEHCYLGAAGEIEIIDCIEFNDRFRYGDVCADIAFLSMDLAWHERVDLSEALLAYYARATADYDLYGLIDFYESYRAYVRAKVSSMLESDSSADRPARERAAAQARKYYLLAEACTRAPLQGPAVYAVGGVIASGKSTVAEQLGALVNAPVLDADRTRKQLAGVDPTTRLADAAFGGSYSAQASERVYAELLRRAAVVLGSGRAVVLDASFRGRDERVAAFELAKRSGASFLFVECAPPLALCKERLKERAKGPSVSDGRAEVFDAFVASWQPVAELPPELCVRLDTGRPLAETMVALAERLR